MGLLFVGDWLPRNGPDYRGLLGGLAGVGKPGVRDHEPIRWSTDKAYNVVRDLPRS